MKKNSKKEEDTGKKKMRTVMKILPFRTFDNLKQHHYSYYYDY